MDRLGTDTLLHVVKHLAEHAPRTIVDYRLFRVEEPGLDGILRQHRKPGLQSTESLESLLSRGYTIFKIEWRPIPEGKMVDSELWAHVITYS